MDDRQALDAIHAAMDGAYWDSDLWDVIAQLVLATGRKPFRSPEDPDADARGVTGALGPIDLDTYPEG